ncbi:hypothetical protein B0H66DRAFT_598882 [Apodospora peruviana]|uniref:Adenylate kinase n=1 Tax=Apodospora peruviana TaxID=516989 RepID=A0AAE0MHN9_9PEZI|nr:hypothetical protein B0H66DRAFT_598882 [Apodospora peruviana]
MDAIAGTAPVSQQAHPVDCIIAILGAPASGKGTLCKKAASDLQFAPFELHHVSVGDLLRGMPSGPDINGHIAAGTVLPGDELVPILAAHISGLSSQTERPRTKIVLLDDSRAASSRKR